jgi:pyridoxal phosphate enzyme (YggS family)
MKCAMEATDEVHQVSAVSDRRADLAANLADVEARIAVACRTAGRPRDEVRLIAVTKTFPASDVALLHDLGVRDMGESRDQEAAPKAAALGALADLRWHFIGALQTNKCASVARYADVVHSVDRSRLITALDDAAFRAGRRLSCLVQVDLDDADRPGRAGAAVGDVSRLADELAATRQLDLAGVMAVAPRAGDPGKAFSELAIVAAEMRHQHPAAMLMSAGMSGDLEAAVAAGATHLRVGTALLGSRGHPVG